MATGRVRTFRTAESVRTRVLRNVSSVLTGGTTGHAIVARASITLTHEGTSLARRRFTGVLNASGQALRD